MRAIVTAFGPPDVLRLEPVPDPVPGAGEVAVAVEASSCVFTDVMIRRNLYAPLKPVPPFVPGYDLVGRVAALGPGVAGLRVGDRVADLTQAGANADVVLRPAAGLVPVPEGLDAAEAEAMVLSGVTALQALTRMRPPLPEGARVLVTGAAGAVGDLALQICALRGWAATGTGSARSLDAIRGRGAVAVAHDAPGLAARLAQAAGPGFDLILDLAGTVPLRRLRRLRAPGGVVVFAGNRGSFGAGAGRGAMGRPFIVAAVLSVIPGAGVRLYDIAGRRRRHPRDFAADLATLFGWLGEGRLRPRIAARLPLARLAEGHARLEAGGAGGRLVVVHAPLPSA